MDEMEFTEAESNMNDLVKNYLTRKSNDEQSSIMLTIFSLALYLVAFVIKSIKVGLI